MKQLDFRSAPLLLIGRDPDMLSLLREVLLDAGFFVVARLSDGFLLNLEKMRDRPHLILYDEALPEMDAERIFYILQDSEDWRDIPFMILSDIYEGARIARCLDRGVAEFIPKPFDVEELAARIRKQLREILEAEQNLQNEALDGFAGDLSYMNLSDLLLNLNQNIRTGELHLSLTNGEDYLFVLYQGKLVRVEGPEGMRGKKAMFRAIRLFYGKFVFHPMSEDPPPTQTQDFGPLPNLVLQAVQEADEFPLTRNQLPEDPDEIMLVNDDPSAEIFQKDFRILHPLLQSPTKRITVDSLIRQSSKTDLDAALEIHTLMEEGHLVSSQNPTP